MTRYTDLFAYIQRKLSQKAGCDNTLRFAKQFAEKRGLFFGELAQTLEECGGHCDCEVLLNAAEMIPAEVIGQERFTTPKKLALERGWYSHCRVGGEPVSFANAVASKKAGDKVEFHVPCKKFDPFAYPDLNRAVAELRHNPEASQGGGKA